MNTMSDFDRRAAAWLADGPTALNDRVLDAALREVHLTHQRRRWPAPWRTSLMSLRLGLAAAVALIVVAVGAVLIVGGGPTPPAATASPNPTAPTSQTTPTVSPATAPTVPQEIDTSSWNTFTSAVYGFTVGYPADWRLERRATRPWAVGDALDFVSPAVDTFASAEGDVGVSVWAVAIDPSPDPTIEQPWEDLEAWIEAFCETTGNAPCTGIHDRVVPLCPDGDTECHTGAMLVPFQDNVAGYKGGRGAITTVVDGVEVTKWVVVSVWQPDSFPSLARFGGGTRLIQAFLQTMGAEPPSRGPITHGNHP